MSKFVVIKSSKAKYYFDAENKIIGRIPTKSNLFKSGSDNDLHFGSKGSNAKIEEYIENITGLKIDNFSSSFDMKVYGTKVKVYTSINADRHIQFLIEKNGKRNGVLKQIFDQYSNDFGVDAYKGYGIFLNFNDNEIFISKIKNETSKKEISILTDRKQETLSYIKRLVKDTESIPDISQRNAYIEAKLNVRSSYYQKHFRGALLREFKCKCAICNINIKELLVASHIVAYCDCPKDEEKIDPNNGLLLCALHDDLFDKGFISFDETGKILLNSDILPEDMYELMNIDKNTKLESDFMNESRAEYLKRHKKRW